MPAMPTCVARFTSPFGGCLETTDLAVQEPERVKELQGILSDLRRDDVTKLPEDLVGINP